MNSYSIMSYLDYVTHCYKYKYYSISFVPTEYSKSIVPILPVDLSKFGSILASRRLSIPKLLIPKLLILFKDDMLPVVIGSKLSLDVP